jgi:hypothetical protein
MLLDCVSKYGETLHDELMEGNAIEAMFRLLQTESNKEQVISALAQWACVEAKMLQTELMQRSTAFGETLASLFRSEPLNLLAPAAKSGLLLCDKCPRLTCALAQTPVVKVLIQSLLERQDLTDFPDVRVGFGSLIMAFYEAVTAPKKMIALFKVLPVARKMAVDESTAVKELGKALLQAVASNYIL